MTAFSNGEGGPATAADFREMSERLDVIADDIVILTRERDEAQAEVARLWALVEPLRALSEAASPGEWHAYLTIHAESWIVTDPQRPGFSTVAQIATGPDDYGKANGELIAAAVNCARALL